MIAALLNLLLVGQAASGVASPLGDSRKVLILGDSITAAGRSTAYLEAFFATRFPDREITFINLGLPSETVSGLSEPGHPYPRPNVHERLERALTRIKPDTVVACYGMNDGIYHPYSDARFAKYQDGILKLVSRCRESGIRVYLVTPPPFDPLPVQGTLQPPDSKSFGWTGTYSRYEEDVLRPYAKWVQGFSGVGFTTIDSHAPILAHLERARKEDPKYILAGDGVHLDASGQWLISQAILEAWHVPKVADQVKIDARSRIVAAGAVKDVKLDSGGLRFTWTARCPMPHDPDWNARIAVLEGIDARLNQYTLTVTGLDRDSYVIYEGDLAIGRASRMELEEGIDLLKLPELSTNRRAAELGALVIRRERIMSPAWLDEVGHKRPDTGKGLPIAEAMKQSKSISEEIRKLAQPRPIELRLVP